MSDKGNMITIIHRFFSSPSTVVVELVTFDRDTRLTTTHTKRKKLIDDTYRRVSPRRLGLFHWESCWSRDKCVLLCMNYCIKRHSLVVIHVEYSSEGALMIGCMLHAHTFMDIFLYSCGEHRFVEVCSSAFQELVLEQTIYIHIHKNGKIYFK